MNTAQPPPVLFFGHGSPMNAIAENKYTREWVDVVKKLNKPRSILIISAHWYTNGTFISTIDPQPTIYDFYGFPEELYNVKYSPKLDNELVDKILQINQTIQESKNWGIDHGSWSILKHIYPNCDVPVIQLSINKNYTMEESYYFAKQLQSLRNNGVMVICSGNIVHNLRKIDWNAKNHGYDWTIDFNKFIINEIQYSVKTKDLTKLFNCNDHQYFTLAVPTAEHFIPLFYALGFATGNNINFFAQGYEMGSLSMDSFIVD